MSPKAFPKVTSVPCISFQYEDRHAKWDTNQAGFSHSHQHGFGLLNAWRLVNAAKVTPRSHGHTEQPSPMAGTGLSPWGDTVATQGQRFGRRPASPHYEAAFGMKS